MTVIGTKTINQRLAFKLRIHRLLHQKARLAKQGITFGPHGGGTWVVPGPNWIATGKGPIEK